MSSSDQIVKWLKSEPSTQTATSMNDLLVYRDRIAKEFHLLPSHPSIEAGFIEFLRLPREFKIRHRPTQILDLSSNFDKSWVDKQRQIREEKFWPRLENFLIKKRNRDQTAVLHLDDESDCVLECLSDPAGPEISRVGVVVGYVQSGKTANMAALISKAADVGYKVVIVFAGVLDSLRQQTQLRFDQEITGGDSEVFSGPWKHLIRISRDGDEEWVRQTKASPHTAKIGDFDKPINLEIVRSMKNVPHLFVIKKNPNRLNKLKEYLLACANDVGELKFPLPTLIIDDEADQATINTKYKKDEITKTNRAIRELLNSIKVRTYVGYTATPFANFLIDPALDPNTAEGKDLGADLFPKDFIVALNPPVGYFGARKLFGLHDPDDPERDEPGMPVFREISIKEVETARTARTKNGFRNSFPSLCEAVDSFLLSCAARIARGQGQSDMSMLLHPSSYQTIHDLFAEPLALYIKEMQLQEKRVELHKRLEKLWESDFVQTTQAIKDNSIPTTSTSDWSNISQHIDSVLQDIEIKVLNSNSQDELQYFDVNRPRRYIVIGGNKLSRGLTLEGLSVSYFLRNSVNYDTILQMGRWFGFRSGYADLTRLYMTAEVKHSFAMLAVVESDLREQLKIYERDKIKPIEAPPKIRKLPQLLITARNRMGAGEVDVDYSEIPTQVAWMNFSNPEELSGRNKKLGNFYSNLKGGPKNPLEWGVDKRLKKTTGFYLWDNPISTLEILSLVDDISLGKIHKDSFKQYLGAIQTKNPSLRWYCAIAGVQDGKSKVELQEFGVNSPVTPTVRRANIADINYIGNPDSPTDRELLEDYMRVAGLVPSNTAFLTTYIVSADTDVLFAHHPQGAPLKFIDAKLPFLTAPVFRMYPQKTPPITVSVQSVVDRITVEQEDDIQPDGE